MWLPDWERLRRAAWGLRLGQNPVRLLLSRIDCQRCAAVSQLDVPQAAWAASSNQIIGNHCGLAVDLSSDDVSHLDLLDGGGNAAGALESYTMCSRGQPCLVTDRHSCCAI